MLSYEKCVPAFHAMMSVRTARMPRRHKGPEAVRKYDSTQRALADVQNNYMSVKKAAFLHCINHTTLMNHLKQLHCCPVGRPTLLAPNEEKSIVHALQKLRE